MSTQPAEPQQGSGEDAEKHFWDEHEKRTRTILDKWFDEKVKSVQNSRNGGRNTLPRMLADLFFPEPAQK
jgi:hypothetical protein